MYLECMARTDHVVNAHFDRWHGAPAAEACAHCCAGLEPGADFLIGNTMKVADIAVCSDACAFAELVACGAVKPRTRTETAPGGFLARPGAARVLAAEWMAELGVRGEP